MELGLGTAQFGLPYGVMAGRVQVADDKGRAIFECAVNAGLRMMDTALAYGQGQEKLGEYLEQTTSGQNIQIVTKTAPNLRLKEDIKKQVLKGLQDSLKYLKQDKLHALLVHDIGDLLEDRYRQEVIRALETAKDNGLVSKIGFSAYDNPDIETVLTHWKPDIVQLPVNILDQRLVRNGVVNRLKQSGVEIHLRSAFLQGVILASPSDLPGHLTPLTAVLNKIRNIGNPLQLALGYLRTQTDADIVLVGAHETRQLEQIMRAWTLPPPVCDFGEFQIDDVTLVDPRRWPQ